MLERSLKLRVHQGSLLPIIANVHSFVHLTPTMYNVLRQKWSGVQWYIMPGPLGMEMLLRDRKIAPHQELKNNLTSCGKRSQGRCKPASSIRTRLWTRLPIRRGKAPWGRREWSRFLNNGQQVQLQEVKTGHDMYCCFMMCSHQQE